MFKLTSISRMIISGVFLAELISLLLMTVTSVLYERHTHFKAFDTMVHGRAESLLGAVGDADDAEDNLILDVRNVSIPEGDLFEVQDAANGRLLGRSQTWPQEITAEIVRSRSTNGTYHTIANKADYHFVRIDAARIVDPGEHGGVKRNITVLYGSPTTNVWQEVRGEVRFYSAVSLLLLIATAVLIAWFLRRALSPLYELTSEAASISIGNWSFNPANAARTTRELAPLTRAIEATLARLEQSFVQQRRFVSDAAHELKTDVAIIKSSLQLLAMKDRPLQDYLHGLDVCLDDCDRLENTVVKMLTLARAEYNSALPIPLSDQAVDMAKYVEESIQKFSSLAELRRVSVTFTRCESARVNLEEEDCALLSSNLLHNALQHSPPGSTVSISLIAAGDFLTMLVEDEGEGISDRVLPHIFEPFFRADCSRDRKSGGTGLGLAICKAICDRAGGSIAIGRGINKGTRVSLQLPLRVPVEA